MSRDLDKLCESKTTNWRIPERSSLPEKYRETFDRRVLALRAVISGGTVREASQHFGVNRGTLSSMVQQASQPGLDGKPMGYRVCIPWIRKTQASPNSSEIPMAAGPHAFTAMLKALPEIASLLSAFSGGLPRHNQPSRKFEVFFRQFKRALRDLGHDSSYPLNTSDQGRRALIAYLTRYRTSRLDAGMAINDDQPPESVRLDQLIQLQPFDRVEFDAHPIDHEWWLAIPTQDDAWTLKQVAHAWLLALIDVVSLAVLAWTLVIGVGYDKFDVISTFAKALTPWKPRELIVPNLHYAPDAWMPSMTDGPDDIVRPATTALDNAWAHKSKLATENLGDHQLGIVNLGYPHVPQGRPNIEAFFKRIEDAFLRFIAGGYRPKTSFEGARVNTTGMSGKAYPLFVPALEELIDVEISAYNVSALAARQDRTPRQIVEWHRSRGMWVTQSTLTARDAQSLLTMHVTVTIRGSRPKSVLPHVKLFGTRYRNRKLNSRYDLCGRKFNATIDVNAAHRLTLLDDNGSVFTTLEALHPWSAPHTLELRNQALKYVRHGALQIIGTDNAVAAYHEFIRAKAAAMQWATDEYAKRDVGAAKPHDAHAAGRVPSGSPTATLTGLLPRGGAVDLRSKGRRS